MNVTKHVCALAVAALTALSASAQTSPASIAAVESQIPKNGMTQQYEQGRKQKADWHKQQKDPQPLYVFETLTGDSTGTYLVVRLDQHWADLDKPAIPDASDTEEYSKVIGAYVLENAFVCSPNGSAYRTDNDGFCHVCAPLCLINVVI